MSLYLDNKFFLYLALLIILFVAAEFWPVFMGVARAGMVVLGVVTLIDVLLLYGTKGEMTAEREMADRLSNGDENPIRVTINNRYRFPVGAIVIDEVPTQFQMRDAKYETQIPTGGSRTLRYTLRPVRRGSYTFGNLNVYARSPLCLAQRRFRLLSDHSVPVYPSYIQMRKYELMAQANRLAEIGVKRVRKVGQTMEFDQIREYVQGDDYRRVNWKATARKGGALMVNQYQDERSQRVYSLIDKGRAMQMPFEGMTLLDYAINASLVLSSIAIGRQDRAGLVTFADQVGEVLPADRSRLQMKKIVETLYNQKTLFPESDYRRLSTAVRRSVQGRSLLVLFTNIDTLSNLRRRMPALQSMGRHHLLLVVFFENTELRERLAEAPKTTEDIAVKGVAERFAWEKRQIVRELESHGILALYTTPANLTSASINKYLEIKARRLV